MNKYNHVIVLAILVFICTTIYQWLNLRIEAVKAEQKITALAKHNTFNEAKRLANALKELRVLYAQYFSKISDATQLREVQYDSLENAIPLPPTISAQEFKKMISFPERVTINLVSSHDFLASKKLTANQQKAVSYFLQNPNADKSYYIYDDEKALFFYAIPDKLTHQSLVNAYNLHPKTTKNNWQIGDVCGMIWIEMPYQEIHEFEHLELTGKVNNHTVIAISVFAIIVALTAFILRFQVTEKSVKELQSAIRNIERGKVEDVNVNGHSFMMIAHTLQLFIRNYEDKAKFAQAVGDGNFNAQIQRINEDDVLVMSLMEMRDKLQRYVTELRISENELRNQTQELQYQRDKIQEQHRYLLELTDKMIENEKVLTQSFMTIKEKQKIIETKNKLITSSIKQAFTIQQAILPTQEELSGVFSDFFTFYRPKDIVSGDFFWFFQNEERVFFAIVDCTGHGVPGGFMSMLGIAYLNEIVLGTSIKTPARVLNVLDSEVRQSLHQERNTNMSGMDISLCVFEKSTRKLTFAGAKLPAYVYENEKIRVIKGSSKLIGGKPRKKQREFIDHDIPLRKNTIVYLATDGFIDQNNEARDKYGSTAFIEFLQKNSANSSSMIQIKQAIKNELGLFQGDEEQRDDITVAGFRF